MGLVAQLTGDERHTEQTIELGLVRGSERPQGEGVIMVLIENIDWTDYLIHTHTHALTSVHAVMHLALKTH